MSSNFCPVRIIYGASVERLMSGNNKSAAFLAAQLAATPQCTRCFFGCDNGFANGCPLPETQPEYRREK